MITTESKEVLTDLLNRLELDADRLETELDRGHRGVILDTLDLLRYLKVIQNIIDRVLINQ